MEKQDLVERLAAWGYAAGDNDTAGLLLAGRWAEAYARQFCGLAAVSDLETGEVLPQDMQEVLLDLAGVYFLRSRLGLAGDRIWEHIGEAASENGDINADKNNTGSAGVTSLRLGDISVGFGAKAGSQQERLADWLAEIERGARERLIGWRRLRF